MLPSLNAFHYTDCKPSTMRTIFSVIAIPRPVPCIHFDWSGDLARAKGSNTWGKNPSDIPIPLSVQHKTHTGFLGFVRYCLLIRYLPNLQAYTTWWWKRRFIKNPAASDRHLAKWYFPSSFHANIKADPNVAFSLTRGRHISATIISVSP